MLAVTAFRQARRQRLIGLHRRDFPLCFHQRNISLDRRSFWNFSGGNGGGDEDGKDGKDGKGSRHKLKSAEEEEGRDSVEGTESIGNSGGNGKARSGSKNSIVSQSGENSPHLSPLLILPIARRPVFPGFLSSILLRDTKTIDAIYDNLHSSGSYLGVFYRKDGGPGFASSAAAGGTGTGTGGDSFGSWNDDVVVKPAELIRSMDEIYKVGTFAQVQSLTRTDFGAQLIFTGQRRISLKNVQSLGPPIVGDVTHWKRRDHYAGLRGRRNAQSAGDSADGEGGEGRDGGEASRMKLTAYTNEVISAIRDVIRANPMLHESINSLVMRINFSDPYQVADFGAAIVNADGAELQAILEAKELEMRLELVLEALSKERELQKVQREIQRQVEEKVGKQQREYFLREQLKNIKQELGIEKDDKDDLVTKYTEKLRAFIKLYEQKEAAKPAPTASDSRSKKARDRKNRKSAASSSSSSAAAGAAGSASTNRTEGEKKALLPTHLQVISDEIKKLQSLEKNSPEFNVTRSYLDWLVSVPWDTYTVDVLNVHRARRILDADHFGLQEIKARILEFIAVGKLKGSVAGKIICFVGPPGVGKTSIAKSIASALDREFYRFSVGGLTDTAEIKGHRRTYIGAMPGKPVQCLKTTECLNPLILIDEIDKLGRSYSGGDPASALLELLDPNQNESFIDHYLDVPVDFSKVLFVCTANDESTIPGPLRDRMEMIRLSGYDIKEKVAIAAQYLVPAALADAGLDVKDRTLYHLQYAATDDDSEPLSDAATTAATTTSAMSSDVEEAGTPAELINTANEAVEELEEGEVEESGETRAEPASEEAVDGQEQGVGLRVVHPAVHIPPVEVKILESALELLVKSYCRESGVRSLEKMIERVARKIAFDLVMRHKDKDQDEDVGYETTEAAKAGEAEKGSNEKRAVAEFTVREDGVEVVEVNPANLEIYVGKPIFAHETIYEQHGGEVEEQLLEEEEEEEFVQLEQQSADQSDGNGIKNSGSGSNSSGDSAGQKEKENKNKNKNKISRKKLAALPVGVVMGLGWNPLGGSPIFIETVAIPLYRDAIPVAVSGTLEVSPSQITPPSMERMTSGGLTVTGQLGDVMKESVNIAYTYARKFVSSTEFMRSSYALAASRDMMRADSSSVGVSGSSTPPFEQQTIAGNVIDEGKEDAAVATAAAAAAVQAQQLSERVGRFFTTHQIHLHAPEGAVSKDGPSAGVAMTTAFISSALNTPVRAKVAMTGEISLTGKVLPVGGIKEKILAALRSGAHTVLLPAANQRDFAELPDYIKDKVTVHFVSDYDEAFELLFAFTSTSSPTTPSDPMFTEA